MLGIVFPLSVIIIMIYKEKFFNCVKLLHISEGMDKL